MAINILWREERCIILVLFCRRSVKGVSKWLIVMVLIITQLQYKHSECPAEQSNLTKLDIMSLIFGKWWHYFIIIIWCDVMWVWNHRYDLYCIAGKARALGWPIQGRAIRVLIKEQGKDGWKCVSLHGLGTRGFKWGSC